jgi:hypothetical protein
MFGARSLMAKAGDKGFAAMNKIAMVISFVRS